MVSLAQNQQERKGCFAKMPMKSFNYYLSDLAEKPISGPLPAGRRMCALKVRQAWVTRPSGGQGWVNFFRVTERKAGVEWVLRHRKIQTEVLPIKARAEHNGESKKGDQCGV